MAKTKKLTAWEKQVSERKKAHETAKAAREKLGAFLKGHAVNHGQVGASIRLGGRHALYFDIWGAERKRKGQRQGGSSMVATVYLTPKEDGTHIVSVELPAWFKAGIEEAGYKIAVRKKPIRKARSAEPMLKAV